MNDGSSTSETLDQRMTDQEVKMRIDQVFEEYANPRYLLKQEFEVYFLTKEKLTEKEILYLWGRAEDLGYLRTGLDNLTDENKNQPKKIGKLNEWMEELRKDGHTDPTTHIVLMYERTTESKELKGENSKKKY